MGRLDAQNRLCIRKEQKMTRKTRITKKQIAKARAERKKTVYQRKKQIIPGPWTNVETELKVNAKLKLNNSSIMAQILGPCYGTYKNDSDWQEKSWYPIYINIEVPRLKQLVEKHGINKVMAACEKSLTEQSKYGTIVLLNLGVDHSQNISPKKRFLSVLAKTNKKNIEGFRAIRKQEYIVIGKSNDQ